jgi:hypothetical protein
LRRHVSEQYDVAMIRVFVAALMLLTVGCKREPAPVKEIAVADAAAQFAAGKATPVDANVDEYRDAVGWVPGAVRLTDYNEYPLTELPQDKDRPLVFYCTSRM